MSLIQMRETQVFVCARTTLDWRIALDLKRVVGFLKCEQSSKDWRALANNA